MPWEFSRSRGQPLAISLYHCGCIISYLDILLHFLDFWKVDSLHKNWSFPLRISNPQFPTDLVTFAEEILNGKLHFLCSVCLFSTFSELYEVFQTFQIFLIKDLRETASLENQFPFLSAYISTFDLVPAFSNPHLLQIIFIFES